MSKNRPTSMRSRFADAAKPAHGGCIAPRHLACQSLQSAQQQLFNAREDLKAARRRVVELERVVDDWRDVALEVEQNERSGRSAAPLGVVSSNN
jgi:hypothetical protein